MSEGTISRGHIEFRPTGLMADARARSSAHAAMNLMSDPAGGEPKLAKPLAK